MITQTDDGVDPLISIIMAARNTEQYIEDCLDSILNQSYSNWELVVANDRSTDGTGEILEKYAREDRRIRVVESEGQKLIPALQTAYKYVQGTLINRMDSDDKMPTDKLESMFQTWRQYGKGTLVAGGTTHFVDEGEVGDGFRRYEAWLNDVAAKSIHYQEIYRECVIPSHCWLIHRSDFDVVGAFNPLVYPEDYDLCFRFYQKGLRVVGMDKILHLWRDRSERISRTWECYRDNRYFNLKVRYFYQLDRDSSRPLVVWGAGRNGKDLVRCLPEGEKHLHWVCDNPGKIGKDIYGHRMHHFSSVQMLINPQILIVVTSPDARKSIRNVLNQWGKQPVKDFWFFL